MFGFVTESAITSVTHLQPLHGRKLNAQEHKQPQQIYQLQISPSIAMLAISEARVGTL
jgi:hypothetical protein